jgi:hypothetical protein
MLKTAGLQPLQTASVLGLTPCALVYVPDGQSLQLDAPAEATSDSARN